MAKITISDENAETVEHLVRRGVYESADAFIEDGIWARFDLEMESHARLQALKEAISLGEADVAAGRVFELRDAAGVRTFFDEIEAELDAEPSETLR